MTNKVYILNKDDMNFIKILIDEANKNESTVKKAVEYVTKSSRFIILDQSKILFLGSEVGENINSKYEDGISAARTAISNYNFTT